MTAEGLPESAGNAIAVEKDASAPPSRRFALLKERRFFLLFLSQVCSLLGDQLYLIVLPFFILDTASAATLGSILLSFGLGRLLTLPLGGIISDRFPRTQVIFGAYLARALVLAALALTPAQSLWMVMAMVALLGVTEGLSLPATLSIVPSVVDSRDLPAANSLLASATMGLGLFGPAIAGAIVHVAGTAYGFGLAAMITVLAFIAIGGLRKINLAAPTANAPGNSTAAELADREVSPSAWQLLKTSEILRFSVIITAIIAITYAGVTEIALPIYTIEDLRSGPDSYGVLLSGLALGGLLGALSAGFLFKLTNRGSIALLIGILQGVAIAIVPLVPMLWFSFAALLVAGVAQSALNVFFVTSLQQRIPERALGKAMSMVLVAAYGGFPIAVTLAGYLIGSVGPQLIMAIGGAMMCLGFAVGFLSREFRNL